MRGNLLFVFSCLFLVFLFQNCSQGQENTFGVVDNTSQGKCEVTPKQITVLGVSNGIGTFELSALDTTQTEWSVDGQKIRNESGRRFTHTFPRSGTFVVTALGYNNNCLSPVYRGEKQIAVEVGTGPVTCTPVLPQLSANPAVANVNDRVTVTLTNASVFQTSSIRWIVNGTQVASGTTSTEVSANAVGNLDVSVSATQLCNLQETNAIRVVVSAVGAPALTAFSYLSTPAPVLDRGTSVNSVFLVPRNQAVNLSFTAANAVTATMAGGVACGANCFTLKAAETATSACSEVTRELVINGNAGTTAARESFYVFCAAGSSQCVTGKLSNRYASEVCSATPPTTTTTTTVVVGTSSTTTTTLPQAQICRIYPQFGSVQVNSNNFAPASANVTLLSGEKITSVSLIERTSGTVCYGNLVYGYPNNMKTLNYGIKNTSATQGSIIVGGGCKGLFRVQICTQVPAAEVRNDLLCGRHALGENRHTTCP